MYFIVTNAFYSNIEIGPIHFDNSNNRKQLLTPTITWNHNGPKCIVWKLVTFPFPWRIMEDYAFDTVLNRNIQNAIVYFISLGWDKNKWGKWSLLLISWCAPDKVRYQSLKFTVLYYTPWSLCVITIWRC